LFHGSEEGYYHLPALPDRGTDRSDGVSYGNECNHPSCYFELPSHEYAHVEEQDAEFGEANCNLVEQLCYKEPLPSINADSTRVSFDLLS